MLLRSWFLKQKTIDRNRRDLWGAGNYTITGQKLVFPSIGQIVSIRLSFPFPFFLRCSLFINTDESIVPPGHVENDMTVIQIYGGIAIPGMYRRIAISIRIQRYPKNT